LIQIQSRIYHDEIDMETTSFLYSSLTHAKPIPQGPGPRVSNSSPLWDQETRKYVTGEGSQSGHCWD